MRVKLDKCIACGSTNIEELFNLGDMYPSAFINKPEDEMKFEKSPCIVNWCDSCKNMQMKYSQEKDKLFKEYYYRSGVNKQMIKALDDVVASSLEVFSSTEENYGKIPTWLDIANNDGTLSKLVKKDFPSCFMVGVDPANDLHNEGNDLFINDYFSAKVVRDNLHENIKFDIITCVAMMYDIELIHDFIEDVKSLLHEDGIFVCQLMDLMGRITTYAIDDICEEHLVCYSLECLDGLFKQHGLEIFDCEYNKTNCMSLRIYVGHKDHAFIRENVDCMIEMQKGILTKQKMRLWFDDVYGKLNRFSQWLFNQKKNGATIGTIGASTKANTLLQIANLNNEIIDYAMEVSDFKYNRYTLGSNIPIISEKEIMSSAKKPDVLVGMIWAFKDGILKNFKQFIEDGGSIIFPLPNPHFVDKTGEHYI